MKRIILTGAAALAMVISVGAAHAGGPSGGPVVPGDPPPSECDLDPDSCVGGDEGTGGTGGSGGTGGGGGSPSDTPGASPPTGAGMILFDLETLPHPAYTGFTTYNPGEQSALTQTVSGLTLSLATQADPVFARVALLDPSFYAFNGVPSSFGNVTAFVYTGVAASAPLFANFSAGVSDFSVQALRLDGTFFPTFSITAYSGLNGTGSALGTASTTFGGTGYQATTLSLSSFGSALSFAISGTTAGTMQFDNIRATAAPSVGQVPEPASWMMMIGGFGLLGAAMRRRRIAVRFS